MVERKHYIHRYKYGKQKRQMTINQLTELMLKVKKDRKNKFYLGIDPLRDASLLAIFYWTGLRLAEVVGDRPRRFKVSIFSMQERINLRQQGKDWRKEPNAYIIKTSPERPGIREEDIELSEEKEALLIYALALKHGKRESPLKLSLSLPYVDLIKQQWERTETGEKVWNLKREYAWEIIKEFDPKLYSHYFRFNRASTFVKIPTTSPEHLLEWFGWTQLQTAYHYLALGGRRIDEMSASMVEQYTGKKTEVKPELSILTKEPETLVEEPTIKTKSQLLKTEEIKQVVIRKIEKPQVILHKTARIQTEIEEEKINSKKIEYSEKTCPKCNKPSLEYFKDRHIWGCLNCGYTEKSVDNHKLLTG